MEIHKLDLNFQGLPDVISSFLLVGPEGPVLIETGPSTTIEAMERELARVHYAPADVRHVLLTHIHLDHAGAAGWWARRGAQIYVHHAGAPHLIDPTRLLLSATRIYGNRMQELWGEVLPVDPARITPVGADERLQVAGINFTALDTPGHARHHLVYRLEDMAFTGDAAAIHLDGSNFISLPTPPPEFDLEAWRATIARLAQENLAVLFPTHCCPIEDVRSYLAEVDELLVRSAEFVRECMLAGQDRDQILPAYEAWNEERGRRLGLTPEALALYHSVNPLFMSVDGLMRYWSKRI